MFREWDGVEALAWGGEKRCRAKSLGKMYRVSHRSIGS